MDLNVSPPPSSRPAQPSAEYQLPSTSAFRSLSATTAGWTGLARGSSAVVAPSPATAPAQAQAPAPAPAPSPASASAVAFSGAGSGPGSGIPLADMASSPAPLETPSPSNSRSARTRTRHVDALQQQSPEDPDKGGRSLRKRTRVDYSIDKAAEEEEAYAPVSTPSAGRSLRKRRAGDADFDGDDVDHESESRVKRRNSEQLAAPSGGRRGSRKSFHEAQPYESGQHSDDVVVHDTIEVGGHLSEQSDSSFRRTSSGSSNGDPRSARPAPFAASHSFSDPSRSFGSATQTSVERSFVDAVGSTTNVTSSAADPAANGIKADGQEHTTSFAHLTPYYDSVKEFYPAQRVERPEPDAEPENTPEDPAANAADDGIEDQAEGDEETPAGSPAPPDTTANSPAPELEPPAEAQTRPRKQYAYPKIRPASDFAKMFENVQSLSKEELYARLEVAQQALSSWQNEFNGLRKITDDEDNALRYQQEEAAFRHREKMALSKDPNANPIRKDFVVKGIRAEKPDSAILYQRQQDKIMAHAYLFEYDDRESKIGAQEPDFQRSGIGKGRLRDRPKQTAKAAEADDPNVVHGKRARKAPTLFAGNEAPSRGSTPAPSGRGGRRGGRRGGAAQSHAQYAEENGDASAAQNGSQSSAAPTPKKKGKGGRPRKHPLPEPIPEGTPVPVPESQVHDFVDQDAEAAAEQKLPKKRGRKSKAEKQNDAAQETAALEPTKPTPRRARGRKSDIASDDAPFELEDMPKTAPTDDSRPRTASSTGTVSTTTSTTNYKLRQKRQKRFAVDDEEEQQEEERAEEEQPRPKRQRRAPKKAQGEDFGPAHDLVPSVLPASEPTPMPQTLQFQPPTHQMPDNSYYVQTKPQPKIKIKTNTLSTQAPSFATASPINGSTAPLPSLVIPQSASSNGTIEPDSADPNKDYNTMTKSEKMSYSMKARWASGSMSPAVAKRRATLAAKKQATNLSPVTTKPEPEQGGQGA